MEATELAKGDSAAIAEKDSLIRSISLQIFGLDSIAAIDTLNNYNLQREILVSQLSAEISALSLLLTQNQAAIDNALNDAAITNSAVIPAGLPEANEKFINEVELLFNGDKQNIENLYYQVLDVATQCPSEGGKAVYRARAFVSLFNDSLYYDDRIICLQNGGYRSIDNSNELKNVIIVPNPANDKVTVSLVGKYEGICEIIITDIVGKSLYSTIFDCSKKMVDISTRTFNPGIYNLQVKINAKFVEQEKLIIIR